MAPNIKVIFEIMTKNQGQINQLQAQINAFARDTQKAFGALAGVAGVVVGFEGVRRTIGDSIKKYAEHEEVVARLNQALGHQSQALLDLADARQKVTKYDDEETILAEAYLADYIKEESRIKTLIPLIQDFATAKRLDLVTASDMVVKSIQTETNAMRRQGIDIHGAAGSTERYTSAVNALTAAFGGNAEAVGRTAAGQMAIFKHSLDEVSESLGKTLMPVLTTVIQAFERYWVPALQHTVGFIDEMVTGYKVLTKQSLGDSLRDLTLIDDKMSGILETIDKVKNKKGVAGFLASIYGTGEDAQKDLWKQFDALATQRAKLQKQVEDMMHPTATPTRSDVSFGKPAAGHKGMTGSQVWMKSVEDDYKAALAGNKAFFDLQKKANADIESNYQEAIKNNEQFRRTQEEIDKRYSAAQLSSLGVWGNQELETMKAQHAAELDDLRLTLQQRQELMKAQAMEERRLVRETNYMKLQTTLGVTSELLTALSDAASADIAIEKNRKEQMKPILRAMAIMRFAVGTASGIASAWELNPWPVALAATIATAVENGAMLATQLSAINSAAVGANFITSGRELMMVGDNPGGREHVTVTPLSSPNYRGPQNTDNSVDSINIYVNDQLTGDRLIKAIRSGNMRSGMADLKRALALA